MAAIGTDVMVSLSTRETVDCDTPATWAMSCIVTVRGRSSRLTSVATVDASFSSTVGHARSLDRCCETSLPRRRALLHTLDAIGLYAYDFIRNGCWGARRPFDWGVLSEDTSQAVRPRGRGSASLAACGDDDAETSSSADDDNGHRRRHRARPTTRPTHRTRRSPRRRACRAATRRRHRRRATVAVAAATSRCGSGRAATPRWSTPSSRRGTRQNPDRQINLTYIPHAEMVPKLAQAIASGDVPDLMGLDLIYGPQFAAAGQLEDITDLIGDDPTLETISEGHRAVATWEDRLYGVPLYADVSVLFWNKELFAPGRARPREAADEPHRAARHGGRRSPPSVTATTATTCRATAPAATSSRSPR